MVLSLLHSQPIGTCFTDLRGHRLLALACPLHALF